ncbi:hypothetical protein HDU67_006470 [Dinochytrium kinnereticum]|nr:hypothetical protein HDU67_006470 [Dinochytrium kinnereticum]
MEPENNSSTNDQEPPTTTQADSIWIPSHDADLFGEGGWFGRGVAEGSGDGLREKAFQTFLMDSHLTLENPLADVHLFQNPSMGANETNTSTIPSFDPDVLRDYATRVGPARLASGEGPSGSNVVEAMSTSPASFDRADDGSRVKSAGIGSSVGSLESSSSTSPPSFGHSLEEIKPHSGSGAGLGNWAPWAIEDGRIIVSRLSGDRTGYDALGRGTYDTGRETGGNSRSLSTCSGPESGCGSGDSSNLRRIDPSNLHALAEGDVGDGAGMLKRRRSVAASENRGSGSPFEDGEEEEGGGGGAGLSKEEEKDLVRRRRNTEAARRSRDKKNAKLSHLEGVIGNLERENSNLKIRAAVLQNDKTNLQIRERELQKRISALEGQLEEVHRTMQTAAMRARGVLE